MEKCKQYRDINRENFGWVVRPKILALGGLARLLPWIRSGLKVEYHPTLMKTLEVRIAGSGWTKADVRKATEYALRWQLHRAFIERADDAPLGTQPAIYTMSIGGPRRMRVHFTRDETGIMVRGYSYDRDVYSIEDGAAEAGSYIHETAWDRAFDHGEDTDVERVRFNY